MSLPLPPPALPAAPPLLELRPGLDLVRFYDPFHGPWDRQRSYGPLPGMRFDHHPLPVGDASGCSVWYAARSLIGAVSEVFGDQEFLDRDSGRRVCFVKLRTPLTVLNLQGVAARAFDLDQRIGTDEDSERTQAWARAFYGSYPEIHGIRWSGRQAGSICIVFNNRISMDSLSLVEDRDIAHSSVWPRISRAARRAYLPILAP